VPRHGAKRIGSHDRAATRSVVIDAVVAAAPSVAACASASIRSSPACTRGACTGQVSARPGGGDQLCRHLGANAAEAECQVSEVMLRKIWSKIAMHSSRAAAGFSARAT
jgi:hypothetical protein